MHKHLVIALAGAAACSVQAQSSVTLYGSVGTQLVYASGTTKVKHLDANSIVTPRLGVKGSEDLGGGLKGVFTLESQISPDTGTTSSTFWNRGSYVGVQGGFGSLTLGRQWNLNDDLLCGLYVCGGYAAFYNFAGFGYSSDLVDNAAKYMLPAMGGLSGGVMLGASEGAGRYTGLAGTYSGGSFTVGLGWDAKRGINGQDDKLTLLAGKVSFGPGFVRLAYADAKPRASGAGDAKAWDLGGGMQFGAASLSLDYVAMDRKNSANDANFWRVVGIYALSKRTQLNGNLSHLNNKGASAVALAGGSVNPGGSQNVVTLGIAHSF